MEVSAEVEIARAPEDVFAFLTVHENHKRFIVENVSSEQVTPGPLRVGARVENRARVMGGEMIERFEITHLEPPRLLAKSSLPGSTFATTDRFELTPTQRGTRVKLTVTGAPRGLAQRAMMLVIEPLMRRSVRKALARLAEILEASAPAAAA